MKKHLSLIIIFAILSININGQNFEFLWFTNTPCDEGYERDTMFAVSYHEMEEIYSNLNRKINLFEGIDFQNEPVQIIYGQFGNRENYYHISNKNELLKLKSEDYLNIPVYENSEECYSKGYKIKVVLKDTIIETYDVSEECGFINTKCKKFKYDSKRLINSGKQCFYQEKKSPLTKSSKITLK